MAIKQFKTESKKLLDIMINSIYTHKEIFLRELISNASDAIDKRYYLALTKEAPSIDKKDLAINIAVDKANRTIMISDNGLGLDEKEMDENLGVIASSGSLAFKEAMESNKAIDIIGQFGVGFYSAFMVAQKISVLSKRYDSEQAYLWESEGEEGYSIKKAEKKEVGTIITLTLKEDSKEEKYSEFLDSYRIKNLVKKYSDYVRYPITMVMEKSVKKADSDEYETKEELETLNSMIPLWKRSKKSIKEEEYHNFYENDFYDYQPPQKTIHFSVEGNVAFDALLFIPQHASYDFYDSNYERGLKLYSRNVFIMEKCSDLIPEYFQFVRGLVDSQDLSLNISRELLQHNRQLKVMAAKIEKKIKSELENMLENDREEYLKFYQAFGYQLKYSLYKSQGFAKDILQDLLLFYSSKKKELITLKEYVANMKEGQEVIYYACGESKEKIDMLPQLEVLKDQDYEVLYLPEPVDEFVLLVLNSYDGKNFKSANQGDLNLKDEKTKKKLEKLTAENQGLLDLIKETLGNQVVAVKLSSRLKNAPVCLSAEGEISLEMEKVINLMPNTDKIKSAKVLEINSKHELFKALVKLYEKDQEAIKNYADLLYNQARLIEGFTIEDPTAFSNKMIDLMIKAGK